MNKPTLEMLLQAYAEADSKYWFENDGDDILSCVKSDEVSLKGVKSIRTVTQDFAMCGLTLEWTREVIVRVPRKGYQEIRGEARVKYTGAWEYTPDLIMARLGITKPP